MATSSSYCAALATTVDASTSWSCGGGSKGTIKSKSQRRRARYRRSAILRSKIDSRKVNEMLGLICEAGAQGSYNDDKKEKRVEENPGYSLDFKLTSIEWKLDLLMGWASFAFAGHGPVADFGIPSQQLENECMAARAIQRVWRRHRAQKKNDQREESISESVDLVDLVGRFELLPSVGTWLKPLLSVEDRRTPVPHTGLDLERPTPWDERKTGEEVNHLVAAFASQGRGIEALADLEKGIATCKQHCPETNRPWLDELVQKAKMAVESKLPHSQPHGELESSEHVLDQQWQDESKQRWWFNGWVICYMCGASDCEDVDGRCCERRRRDILNLDDERRPRHKGRNRRKR